MDTHIVLDSKRNKTKQVYDMYISSSCYTSFSQGSLYDVFWICKIKQDEAHV